MPSSRAVRFSNSASRTSQCGTIWHDQQKSHAFQPYQAVRVAGTKGLLSPSSGRTVPTTSLIPVRGTISAANGVAICNGPRWAEYSDLGGQIPANRSHCDDNWDLSVCDHHRAHLPITHSTLTANFRSIGDPISDGIADVEVSPGFPRLAAALALNRQLSPRAFAPIPAGKRSATWQARKRPLAGVVGAPIRLDCMNAGAIIFSRTPENPRGEQCRF